MNKDQREVQRKLRILQHAVETGSVVKTCRYFGISRSGFYRWRDAAASVWREEYLKLSDSTRWAQGI